MFAKLSLLSILLIGVLPASARTYSVQNIPEQHNGIQQKNLESYDRTYPNIFAAAQIETEGDCSPIVGDVAGDVTIGCGEVKAEQPEQAILTITPILDVVVKETAVRTSRRDGVSTGSLTNKKCKSFSYGATAGWLIDPSTITFVKRKKGGDSEKRVVARSVNSITVEYCAKSQISKLKKKTGDSFASVRYTESREAIQKKDGSEVQAVIIPPNMGATIVLPENTIGFSGVASSELGETIIGGVGKFGNYLSSYNDANRMLTVQWSP